MNSMSFSDAVRAVADLPKPIIDEATDLIHKLLGKPFAVAGNLVADEIYGWQTTNRIRWAIKVAEKLKGRHVEAKVLPKGFLLPVVEAVGNIEDDDLRELWARLTANAVEDENAQHPSFIDALRLLNSEDARAFERAVKNHRPSFSSSVRSPMFIFQRPANDSVPRLIRAGLLEPVLAAQSRDIASALPTAKISSNGRVRVENKSSRGIIVRAGGTRLSAFGWQFYRAIAAEKPTPEDLPVEYSDQDPDA